MGRPAPRPLTQAQLLRQRCARALAKHRRRAGAAGCALDYGVEDLARLAGADACAYCRRPCGFDFHFDHRTPTSRPGGRFTLDNLACCCSRCNALKGQLDAGEFALLRQLLARLHPAAAEDLTRRLLAGGRRYARR